MSRAVALAPADPKIRLARGLALYFRAFPGPPDDWETKAQAGVWAARSEEEFGRAAERDRDLEQAWDMRALARLSRGDDEGAIADFREVRRLDDRFGRIRLSDAYCERGRKRFEKDRAGAIADYETASAFKAPKDACGCDPDAALKGLKDAGR